MAVACPHCSKNVDGWIPEDRLSEMAKAKREATTSAEALAKEVEALTAKATTAATLEAELNEARAHIEKTTATHGQQVAVYRHGITDAEDVADIMAIYQRRAPDGVDLSAWLGSDGLPRSVSALMSAKSTAPPAELLTAAPPAVPVVEATATTGTAPAPATTAAPGTPSPGQPVPTANAGAVATGPAPSTLSPTEIGQMTTEQYKAHRDVLLASLTGRG